ncbi:MAG: hypothetical protein IKP49_11540 [Treponema sp.]|nr:hypothetical protein [Treponema sp.]
MNAMAQQTANWYAQMLMPLESSIKISIINKLAASILEKDNSSKKNMSFFDGLNNSWCDNVTPEDETASIRASRTQGKTRILEDF